MNRSEMLRRVRERADTGGSWDIVVIGGGATGLGIAVDAAARGYDVALFESSDFGKGTSSRSTKLVHGGVRYLQQGNVPLVMEALRERGILRNNAPHLKVSLVMPGHIGTDIVKNSGKILGRDPKELPDEEIEEARARIAQLGFPVEGLTTDQIRQAMIQRAEDFREQAPVTAAADPVSSDSSPSFGESAGV